MSPSGSCENCGAPWHASLACCEFCDVPIPGRVAGIRCPACAEVATADARTCPCCQQSFTKGCVFCGQAAFLTAATCPRCNEAFEGADERKRQRDERARDRQLMGLASQGISAVSQAVGGQGGRQVVGSLFDMIIKASR